MILLSRRATVVALLAIGLLIAIGVTFQLTTERALSHAEAFQFRRMLVSRQGEQNVYRFFYATNRNMDGSEGPIEARFGSSREPGLRFGLFDTVIEPSLGIGMLVDPTDWFQNEEIQLREVRSLERQELVAELRSQVEASPYRSLLVSVNGFRERLPSALRKGAFLAHVLDIDTPVLVFDWPGDQGSTPRGYRRAQAVARESGQELAETLELIIREVEPERLWLVANSMGAEVVVGAFTILHQMHDQADLETKIEDVVLTAPDVSHAEFGARFSDEIDSLTDHLTVYVSSNDRALLMSRVLNRERRLGESTVDPANPDQAQEAMRALELVESSRGHVTLVDVTPINRTRNFHNFSLETPEFFDDLYLRLTNTETPRSRLQYRVRTPGGAEYWVLTRGR
jgi:esterase/lipase superfamily enzyme